MSAGAAGIVARSAGASNKGSSSGTEDAIAALALEALAPAGMATAARGSGPPAGAEGVVGWGRGGAV